MLTTLLQDTSRYSTRASYFERHGLLWEIGESRCLLMMDGGRDQSSWEVSQRWVQGNYQRECVDHSQFWRIKWWKNFPLKVCKPFAWGKVGSRCTGSVFHSVTTENGKNRLAYSGALRLGSWSWWRIHGLELWRSSGAVELLQIRQCSHSPANSQALEQDPRAKDVRGTSLDTI